MTHRTLGFTYTLIAASLLEAMPALAADGVGTFDQRCYSDVPEIRQDPANANQLPIEVSADSAEGDAERHRHLPRRCAGVPDCGL